MSNLLRTLMVLQPRLLMTLMDHPQPPLMMLMDLPLPPSTPPLLKIMPLQLKDMPPLKILPPTPPTPSLPLKLTSAKSWECSPANTSPFPCCFCWNYRRQHLPAPDCTPACPHPRIWSRSAPPRSSAGFDTRQSDRF